MSGVGIWASERWKIEIITPAGSFAYVTSVNLAHRAVRARCHPHFRDEETEGQSGQVFSPGWPGQGARAQNSRPYPAGSDPFPLYSAAGVNVDLLKSTPALLSESSEPVSSGRCSCCFMSIHVCEHLGDISHAFHLGICSHDMTSVEGAWIP